MRYIIPLGKNIIISLVFWVAVLFIPAKSLAYDFIGWYHGASGHDNAIEEAINEETPLIVYFHTDWCKWSKKFNSDYLASYQVDQFLSDIPKVEINPDIGANEKSLCKKYGVTGFPSFFAYIPALGSRAGKSINPFRKNKDWSVDEFLDAIATKLANQYNQKGYSCIKNKKYGEAIRYFELTVSYAPKDAYAYYGMGLVYHSLAYKEKDTGLLEEAESYYLKALEMDPNHKASKEGLERLHKAMEELGIR